MCATAVSAVWKSHYPFLTADTADKHRSGERTHSCYPPPMCGIAAILKIHKPDRTPPPHRESIPEPWLDILDDSIRHRGPDGTGRFRDRATRPDGTVIDIALVHRRLSIIDHENGAQPMVHIRRAEGSDELIQPPDRTKCSSEGAPSASEGSESLRLPDSPQTHRPHSELFSERKYKGEIITTIDATILPTSPDLVAVAFNGCIYNHRELRADLESAGCRFHTDHSDTEALIHGWRAKQQSLPEHLQAMYAMLIWDRARADLLVARDRFGEKPLYCGADAGNLADIRLLVFSSSLPGVVRILEQLDPHRAPMIHRWNTAELITYGHTEPAAPWDNISSVPVRSSGLILDALLGSKRDATGSPVSLFRVASENDARKDRLLPKKGMRSFRLATGRSIAKQTLDPLDKILSDAVARRLEADTPIACLLSGGVDSSLVSHYAKQALGDLTTICVRMPDPRYDESEHARLAADHLGTNHVVVEAQPDAAADLVHLIEQIGLPFGDSSLLPTYWACIAALEVAPVLLTGDGGDEMFVGYDRHMAAQKIAEWPGLLSPLAWLIPHTIFPQRNPTSRTTRLARLLVAFRRNSYHSLLAIFHAPDAAELLGPSAVKPQLFSMPENAYEASLIDREFTLPGDYLRKVDTASMAVPIETRAPFLDDRVRRACDEIGEQLTLGGRKGVLRCLARRHLPREIVDRPKQGFAIPVGEWFRSDFGSMRQLLYDHLESVDPFPGLAEAGVEINMAFVHQMLREHDAAGESSINPWHGRDHSQRLYMLLVLSIWSRWQARIKLENTPDNTP